MKVRHLGTEGAYPNVALVTGMTGTNNGTSWFLRIALSHRLIFVLDGKRGLQWTPRV